MGMEFSVFLVVQTIVDNGQINFTWYFVPIAHWLSNEPGGYPLGKNCSDLRPLKDRNMIMSSDGSIRSAVSTFSESGRDFFSMIRPRYFADNNVVSFECKWLSFPNVAISRLDLNLRKCLIRNHPLRSRWHDLLKNNQWFSHKRQSRKLTQSALSFDYQDLLGTFHFHLQVIVWVIELRTQVSRDG